MLALLEIMDEYFVELNADMSVDAGSLLSWKLDRIISCLNRKVGQFYKLKGDPTPPILELPSVACILRRMLADVCGQDRCRIKMEKFETAPKSLGKSQLDC